MNLRWKKKLSGGEVFFKPCSFQTPTGVTIRVLKQPTLEKQLEVLIKWIDTLPDEKSKYNIIVEVLHYLEKGWRFDYE